VNKKIIIISGDPNSINTEIICKSWRKLSKKLKEKIYIIGNYNLFNDQFKKINCKVKINKVKNLSEKTINGQLKIIDVDLKFKDPFNIKKNDVSNYVLKCFNLGHEISLSKEVSGFINCPVNKKVLFKKNIGVTEFIAKKCKLKNNSEVMMIKSKSFAVSPITTHIDLKDVPKYIKSKTIVVKIKTIQKFYYKLFKKKPKIGVLGLNPHNAELRKESEEMNEIIPAIKKLKRLGYKIEGPLISDTVFLKKFKDYDVLVGMYHDQVLSPFKTIFKFDAINITLGLKYLRISPDHGVAYDIIKKNKANPSSLLSCIKFMSQF
tara:strand:+ start:52 stop:1011 length:960 start_codon:yes stop_codon:yes gene_type:complete